jgi:hypothetical protein
MQNNSISWFAYVKNVIFITLLKIDLTHITGASKRTHLIPTGYIYNIATHHKKPPIFGKEWSSMKTLSQGEVQTPTPNPQNAHASPNPFSNLFSTLLCPFLFLHWSDSISCTFCSSQKHYIHNNVKNISYIHKQCIKRTDLWPKEGWMMCTCECITGCFTELMQRCYRCNGVIDMVGVWMLRCYRCNGVIDRLGVWCRTRAWMFLGYSCNTGIDMTLVGIVRSYICNTVDCRIGMQPWSSYRCSLDNNNGKIGKWKRDGNDGLHVVVWHQIHQAICPAANLSPRYSGGAGGPVSVLHTNCRGRLAASRRPSTPLVTNVTQIQQ